MFRGHLDSARSHLSPVKLNYSTRMREEIHFSPGDSTSVACVAVLNQDIPHIFAMSLFEEYIYWTDWETKSINRAHKTLGTNKTTLISTLHRPMDVHIYHPYRQPPGKTMRFVQTKKKIGLS